VPRDRAGVTKACNRFRAQLIPFTQDIWKGLSVTQLGKTDDGRATPVMRDMEQLEQLLGELSPEDEDELLFLATWCGCSSRALRPLETRWQQSEESCEGAHREFDAGRRANL
jgi:hypothetical protein